MPEINRLTEEETEQLVEKERRFAHIGLSPYERDAGINILEGGVRSLGNAAIFWGGLGLPFMLGPIMSISAGATIAYADDQLRKTARADLVQLTVGQLNEKNGLAIAFSEREADNIAKQYLRDPKVAILSGGLKAVADATIIGGLLNTVMQDNYNAAQVGNERRTVHLTERLYVEKAEQEQAAAQLPKAVML
jgi:hypothetical protein